MGRVWALLNKLYKYKFYLALLFIWGLIVFLYHPILNAQYVWDDTLLFVNKTGLRESQFSWDLVTSPVLPGTSYFRPFIFLTWYWEFNLFGQNPVISHFIGLMVFAINSSLVFWLGVILSKTHALQNGILLSLIAAVLYVTHPSLVESTAWISGRFDQYCTLFMLLGSIIFLKNYVHSEKSLSYISTLAITICYFFALFSKELGLMLPLILLTFYFVLDNKQTYLTLFKNAFKFQKRLIFSIIIATAIYFVLRITSMEQVYHVAMDENYYQNFVILNVLPLYAIKYYFIQVFLTFSNVDILSPLDSIDNSLFGKITAYLSGLLLLLLIIISLVKRGISAALFLCGFISLFLVLYFIPLGLSSNLGHSRFLTLPLAFFALSLAFLPFSQLFEKLNIQSRIAKFIYITVCVCWVGLASLTVKSVTPFWMNEYTLWSWAYKNHPDSALARYNYLYAAALFKQFDQVIETAEKYKEKHGGLEVPDQAVYANALLNKGDKESLKYYEGVISVLPKFHEQVTPHVRDKVNNFNMTAVQIGDVYASYAIGSLLMRNNIDSAIENLKIADWYALPDQKSNINYYSSIAFYLKGDVEQAKHFYERQKKIDIEIGVKNYGMVSSLIKQYCKKYIIENQQCTSFMKNNPFQ